MTVERVEVGDVYDMVDLGEEERSDALDGVQEYIAAITSITYTPPGATSLPDQLFAFDNTGINHGGVRGTLSFAATSQTERAMMVGLLLEAQDTTAKLTLNDLEQLRLKARAALEDPNKLSDALQNVKVSKVAPAEKEDLELENDALENDDHLAAPKVEPDLAKINSFEINSLFEENNTLVSQVEEIRALIESIQVENAEMR